LWICKHKTPDQRIRMPVEGFIENTAKHCGDKGDV
jgi:hypothetical protein